MGGTARQVRAGDHPAVSRRLLDLLKSGELDWDNPGHREAYLRAWAAGELPPPIRPEPDPPAG